MQRREFTRILGASALTPFFHREITNYHSESLPSLPLQKGDKIALIATGSALSEERIQLALKNVQTLGLQAVPGKYISEKQGYLAGTDEQRLFDLQTALEDPSIKAIWCLRGGYGTTRLLPLIQKKWIRNSNALLIGYSDVTALHVYWNTVFRKPSIHGPIAAAELDGSTLASLEKLIFNTGGQISQTLNLTSFESNSNSEITILRHGQATGMLTGGNLSILAALCGTPFWKNVRNMILCIEDIDEEPYRIDRMLVQLKESGFFRNVSAIICGTFSGCTAEHPENSLTLEQTLTMNLVPLNIPIITGAPFGHIKSQCALPFGSVVTLNTSTATLNWIS